MCSGPGSEAMRKAWGCDEEAPTTVFVTSCTSCAGFNPQCEECRGGNEVQHRRCPNKMAEGTEDFMRSYLDWIGDGKQLPFPGQLVDQPAIWVKAVRLADGERHAIDRDRQAAAMRQAKNSGAAKRGRR